MNAKNYDGLSPVQAAKLSQAYALLGLLITGLIEPKEYLLATDLSQETVANRIRSALTDVDADDSSDVLSSLEFIQSARITSSRYMLDALRANVRLASAALAQRAFADKNELPRTGRSMSDDLRPTSSDGNQPGRDFERLVVGALKRTLRDYKLDYAVKMGDIVADAIMVPEDSSTRLPPIVIELKARPLDDATRSIVVARLRRTQGLVDKKRAIGLVVTPTGADAEIGKDVYEAYYNSFLDELVIGSLIRRLGLKNPLD